MKKLGSGNTKSFFRKDKKVKSVKKKSPAVTVSRYGTKQSSVPPSIIDHKIV
ncbi:MAG TPA: hypothetical protein PKD67_11995 [Ignavibacteriaceae bacterium]|nr:hypothetical protein [Ignavibacteriaceae bacterium]